MTDIEIAKNVKLKNITEIAKNIGIKEDEIEVYGKYKAKISNEVSKRLKEKENGKLILVTAIVVSYFLNLRLYLITKSSKVIEASSIWFRIASSLLNK